MILFFKYKLFFQTSIFQRTHIFQLSYNLLALVVKNIVLLYLENIITRKKYPIAEVYENDKFDEISKQFFLNGEKNDIDENCFCDEEAVKSRLCFFGIKLQLCSIFCSIISHSISIFLPYYILYHIM